MAVYYKWIKGCAPGSSLTSGLWTYIKWAEGKEGVAGENAAENLPHIYTYKGKQDNPTAENDLGYILTNKATGVLIDEDWVFSSGTNIKFGNYGSIRGTNVKPGLKLDGEIHLGVNTENDNDGYFSMKVSKWIESNQSVDEKGYVDTYVKTYIGKTGDNYTAYFPKYGSTDNSRITSKLWIAGRTKTVSGISAENARLYVDGSTYIENQCEAAWFNATSDARAKENIRLATYSALDIVKQLPIYNYNYKNNPNERMTGILAQDLLKAQPEDLDLVSNKNATGIDGDYMSIKNDKLMFVLMKAIQEQQEEIQALKEEIKNLRK